jgi:hypothetical protein
MVKHESRRSFSFGYLIPKVGLIYLLSISSMILSFLAVNLIPNDAILNIYVYRFRPNTFAYYLVQLRQINGPNVSQ